MAKAKKFSANAVAQPVYDAIHAAIKDLSREQAVEVLGEIISNAEAQEEAIREEMDEG